MGLNVVWEVGMMREECGRLSLLIRQAILKRGHWKHSLTCVSGFHPMSMLNTASCGEAGDGNSLALAS